MGIIPIVHRQRRLAVVLIANSLLRIASSAGGALVAFYLAHLALEGHAVDAALVGALGIVVNITELAGALPIGVLSDSVGPRVLLVGGALLGAVATQIFGLNEGIEVFYIARALQGLATTVGGPALLAHITYVTADNPAERGRVMSYYELSLLVGLALGGLVGGILWDWTHAFAFSLLAVVYVLIAVLFYWGTAQQLSPTKIRSHPLSGLRHALADPLLRRLAPAWLVVNAIIGMWLTHIGFQLTGPQVAGQYLVGRFSASEVGLILLVFALLFASGVVVWGYVLKVIPRVHAIRISLFAMLMTCLWLYLLNQSEAWSVWARGVLLVLVSLSIMVESGFTPAALAYLADVAGASVGRGSAMGLYTVLLGLGAALGAGLGGVLARALALNGIIAGTVGLLVVALAALLLLPATPLVRTAVSDERFTS